jgi:pimeloyl-ACP methyl ester carboxylesterase
VRTVTIANGLTMLVEDARPGGDPRPPVLCLHGMFGGAWQFERWLSMLAAHGYAAHALDLRGHHGSRPVSDLGRVSLRDFVDDALGAARALGDPIVIGHSMGGLITQKVAETGPARAAVLLCSAPPRGIIVTSLPLIGRQLKYVPEMLASRTIAADRSDCDWLMFNRTPPVEADAIFARLVPESGAAGREMSLGAIAVDARRVICPVLSVTASDDRFVVPRIGRALARKYHAEPLIAVEHGHLVLSEPGWERVAERVIDWMDRIVP